MSKRDRHFERVQAYKDRFAKRPAAWLRERLSFGSLHKEAAIAIREVLTERGEPLSSRLRETTPKNGAAGPTVPREIEDAFYSGHPGDLVVFAVNDPVRVLSGTHAGRIGAVISIEKLSPEVELLVELSDGSDLVVSQSALCMVEETP